MKTEHCEQCGLPLFKNEYAHGICQWCQVDEDPPKYTDEELALILNEE